MKAKVYLSTACCDARTRDVLLKAFDEAWTQIEHSVSQHPRAAEAARMKLAEILLRLAKNGCRDPSGISRAAVSDLLWR